MCKLGPKLGPVLFQLPPNFKKDVDRLGDLPDPVPRRSPVRVEFRHASWFADDVYDVLRNGNGRAVRRGYRGRHDAARGDGRVRLFPAAGRGVHEERTGAVGRGQ